MNGSTWRTRMLTGESLKLLVLSGWDHLWHISAVCVDAAENRKTSWQQWASDLWLRVQSYLEFALFDLHTRGKLCCLVFGSLNVTNRLLNKMPTYLTKFWTLSCFQLTDCRQTCNDTAVFWCRISSTWEKCSFVQDWHLDSTLLGFPNMQNCWLSDVKICLLLPINNCIFEWFPVAVSDYIPASNAHILRHCDVHIWWQPSVEWHRCHLAAPEPEKSSTWLVWTCPQALRETQKNKNHAVV